MTKRLIKLAISLCVQGLDGGRDFLHSLRGNVKPARGVILYYHAIKPDQRSRFARQMDTLLGYAHPFRADRMPEDPQPGRHVAITFDDGYVSVVEQAQPELKQRNIPFTMFIATGCLGERPSWVHSADHPFWSERVVTRDELRTLAADPLVSLGSHSVSHPNFLNLSAQEAGEEFKRSKEDLEDLLEREVDLFSFPHGDHDDALDRQARDAGYRHVFTIEPSLVPLPSTDLVLGRVLADPDDWPVEFRLKLAGAYRWLHGLKTIGAARGKGRSE